MRNNLKNARKDNNLMQSDLAKVLCMTVRQYQRIEKGETKGKVEDWDTLADLFGIDQRILRKDFQPKTEPATQIVVST
jgi:transcriptional regulator with XRE-family HTH domain